MTLDELQDEANRVLAESPIANAEEPFLADIEGYEGLLDGEPSLSEVAKAEELIEAFESERGGFVEDEDIEALAAFIDNHHGPVDARMDTHETIEQFYGAFCGIHNNKRDYATELLDDIGELKDDSLASRYFDYDAFTHDLFIDDHWAHELSTGGVAVFHNV